MQTTDISSTDMQWGTFVASGDLDFKPSAIVGNLGKYDGNGFYQRVSPQNTTLDQYQKMITQMRDDGYIDPSTISIDVTFTIYNPKV